MRKIYPPQMYERVCELKDTHNNRELAEIISKEFDIEMSKSKLKNYLSNHNIKRNVKLPKEYPDRSVFTKEQQAFMKANYKGIGPKEMTEIINEKWNTEYKRHQVKGYYRTHGLNSGLDGRFKKGNVPWCAGKKVGFKRNKSHFKKGHVPDTIKEVGTVAKRVDGYWIKIAEPNIWEQYHRVIYKQIYGAIPPNMNVDFKDGNKYNISPENLMLVSKSDHMKLTVRGHRFNDAELTEAGLNILKIENILEERKKAKC